MAVDTLTMTRQLVAAGFDRQRAEAVADALHAANRDLVTKDDLDRAVAPLATRASLYRALWLQTGAIVATVAGILAIAARLP